LILAKFDSDQICLIKFDSELSSKMGWRQKGGKHNWGALSDLVILIWSYFGDRPCQKGGKAVSVFLLSSTENMANRRRLYNTP